MAKKRKSVSALAQKRWCVLAIFDDGWEVILRDFKLYRDAVHWYHAMPVYDIYPGRTYDVTVAERLVEGSHD